jgi:hypothetical protein
MKTALARNPRAINKIEYLVSSDYMKLIEVAHKTKVLGLELNNLFRVSLNIITIT